MLRKGCCIEVCGAALQRLRLLKHLTAQDEPVCTNKTRVGIANADLLFIATVLEFGRGIYAVWCAN